MTIFLALILGVVEGLTEFFPISSTGHLIFLSQIFQIPETDSIKLFQVFIQFGAVLAILVLYWKDILRERKIISSAIVGFIPAMIVGFFLYKIIKDFLFGNLIVVGSALVIGGILIFIFEKYHASREVDESKIKDRIPNNKEAFIIGLAQALAVIPGTSRSLMTVLSGLSLGFKRERIVFFSFVLSIPTIGAASLYDLYKTSAVITSGDVLFLVVGFLSAFLVSLFVLKVFLGYVKNNSFKIFGFYRIFLGLLILLLSIF